MIQPSLGRVVWFSPGKLLGNTDVVPDDDGRCAAIVTRVHNDRLVNLAVFDANGRHHAKTSVPLVQDQEPKPEHDCYAEWMPYQKSQASKYEELERLAALRAEAGIPAGEMPAGQGHP